MPKIGQDRVHDARILRARKRADGGRQQQKGRCKNNRDNARGVQFDRQVRAFATVHLRPDLTAWILDVYFSHRAFNKDDKPDDGDDHDAHADDDRGADSARPALLEELNDGGGHAGDDADENDQRYAIADAACRDLLAQPHQEHGAANQCGHR